MTQEAKHKYKIKTSGFQNKIHHGGSYFPALYLENDKADQHPNGCVGFVVICIESTSRYIVQLSVTSGDLVGPHSSRCPLEPGGAATQTEAVDIDRRWERSRNAALPFRSASGSGGI